MLRGTYFSRFRGKTDLYVVKAQIHAGGRGAGHFTNNPEGKGGVRLCKTVEEVKAAAEAMMGNTLVTVQTGPEGKDVQRLYVTDGVDIEKEYYCSVLLDRVTSKVTFMVSLEGGMEIEEVAEENPDAIKKVAIDPVAGITDADAGELADALELTGAAKTSAIPFFKNLYQCYMETDAAIVEINPMILAGDEVMALDAKINFDPNALYRQPEVAALRDESEEDANEKIAHDNELSYVRLDGNIGCMVNGAGLAMSTMDIIKLHGGDPANFLDVGGGATAERVTVAFKIILSDPNVKGILDVFDPGHAGTRIRVLGKEAQVNSYDSPTVLSVTLIEDLSSSDPTIDWEEQAFSSVRGYPASVAFHQDRLVIGGSRDLPNRLWFSKSGDLFNFDLGEGLDDEAIEFAILSDQVNAIRGIFSGRHLQVFTSGAEWMVTGDPLTPETVQLNRQTRVGSVIDRYVPPVTVDGATLFVARNRLEMRDFLYTDIEQAYQATDIALLSRHILDKPIDQDFDALRRLLFIVREDGKFATLTMYRAEQVAAWTLHETAGAVHSVSVGGDDVYMLVERNGSYQIELFDDDLNLDSALTGEVETPTDTWSGLDHLEGQVVSIVADGIVHTDTTVTSGQVILDAPATTVEIGLPYTHIIEPLPPVVSQQGETGKRTRLIEIMFRFKDTQALRLDVGQGLRDVALKQLGEDIVIDAPPPIVSEDVRVRALGWQSDGTKPLWRVEQSVPYPFTLLSVTTELKVNG